MHRHAHPSQTFAPSIIVTAALAIVVAVSLLGQPGQAQSQSIASAPSGAGALQPGVESALAHHWWVAQKVDGYGQMAPAPAQPFVGRHSSIAIDSHGNSTISYEDGNNHALRYAQWNGLTWDITVVDTAAPGFAPYMGQFTSLAIDNQDNPHISYHDDMAHSLKYATRSAGAWVTETIDGPPLVIQSTSLALDGDGNPHIAYAGYWSTTSGVYNQRINYAKWTGTEWSIETVTTSTLNGLLSLCLDAQDNPHISFYDDSDRHLKYASRSGPTWDIQLVDPGFQAGLYSSLALDGNGQPHISYVDATFQLLKYARWTGSVWELEVVGPASGGVGQQTSLRLDGANQASIAYIDYHGPINGYGNVVYAHRSDAGWQLERVDSVRDPREPSLALDQYGIPHISYFDPNPDRYQSIQGGLKYARPTTPASQARLPVIMATYQPH